MVTIYDKEEIDRLENNPDYLKLQLNRLSYIMKNECLGDLERLPYRKEYNRLKEKLDSIT